jgi:HK97 gp10 family phage protein
MASGFEINAEEFLAGLKGVFDELVHTAGEQVVEVGHHVAQRAIELCPKGATLDLEHAIGSTGLMRDGRDRVYVEVGVNVGDASTTVGYGFYEEFGSIHNAPHPFMRPALAEAGNYRYSLGTSARQRASRSRRIEKRAAVSFGRALMGKQNVKAQAVARRQARGVKAASALGSALQGLGR